MRSTSKMPKNKLKLPLVLLLFVLSASYARADIMDNEEDELAPRKFSPAPSATQQPSSDSNGDSRGSEDQNDQRDLKEDKSPPAATSGGAGYKSSNSQSVKSPALSGPQPHTKDKSSSANTRVVPPKKPNKSKELSKSGAKNSPSKSPVHFESRGLKGLREKGMVELLQDVIVTQDEMKLESDYAQVFFDEASHEVLKVIAQGNVKINGIDQNSGERFRAVGEKAVFLNGERTVVLEGNAKLWRGEDSVIRSRKITYEKNTGWIRADRVAGEVQAESKTSDTSSKSQNKAQESNK